MFTFAFQIVEKIAPTSLRLDPLYIKVYLIYLNLFIHGIIPFILLVIVNISIYRQIVAIFIYLNVANLFVNWDVEENQESERNDTVDKEVEIN